MSNFDATEAAKITLQNAASPIILGVGSEYFPEVAIQVETRGSRVEVHLWSWAASDWYLPSGDQYIYAVDGAFRLNRSNCPPMKIVAFDNAVFAFFGGER